MNRNYIASELTKAAKEMVSSKYNNPIDQWLVDNGWEETGGIALYTNPKFPLVGVDTNTDTAAVEVFKSKSAIFNDEGALVDYTDNLSDVKKAVEKGVFTGKLWTFLRKKYPGYKGILTSSGISFWANRDDEVSFTIDSGKGGLAVVVGGDYKFDNRLIKRKMSPNVRAIVKFIEQAQQEILAGGGHRR